jgi:hypothetical protein
MDGDLTGGLGAGSPEEISAARGELEDDLRNESTGTSPLPGSFAHLDAQERVQALALRQQFAEQEHGLRQDYGDWIIRLLGIQLLVADVVFIVFAWVGKDWDLTPGVIEIWLAATVVQVVGVAAIVTRHLFPKRDGRVVNA